MGPKHLKFRTIGRLAALLVFGLGIQGVAAAPAVEGCADCHGKDGASTEHDMPIIGGQSSAYLVESLEQYRDKARPCPESKYRAGDKTRPAVTMCKLATDLSAAQMKEVGDALASKPFVRATQKSDPALAAAGKKVHDLHCEKCHADGGSSKDDDSGILAGQWIEYLSQSFKEFGDGSRPMPKKMKPKFEALSDADKQALLQYYGSAK